MFRHRVSIRTTRFFIYLYLRFIFIYFLYLQVYYYLLTYMRTCKCVRVHEPFPIPSCFFFLLLFPFLGPSLRVLVFPPRHITWSDPCNRGGKFLRYLVTQGKKKEDCVCRVIHSICHLSTNTGENVETIHKFQAGKGHTYPAHNPLLDLLDDVEDECVKSTGKDSSYRIDWYE